MGPAERLNEEVAGGGGFEPPLRGPEPRVLPLDDPPATASAAPSIRGAVGQVNERQRIAVFRLRLGRKRGTFAGGILIALPVRGSRPLRAARRAPPKGPKPEIVPR